MLKYLWKRILFAALALFILFVLVFFLMQAVPGYPIVRENNDTDASYLEKVRVAGLLDNIFVQFWRLFSGLFTGHGFGIVYSNGADVLQTMLQPIKYTLLIAGPSFVFAAIIGIFFGIISAYYRSKWPDFLINAIAVLFISIPSFVFALYLIQLAGVIGLPTNFIVPGSPGVSASKVIQSMIVPILSMTLSSISMIIYYTRNELVEVFKQEYIKTALAKGYKFRTVVFKYALRNAMIPIISILAPSFVTILSGSIIIEKFFNVPGTANELVNAITKKETNIVLFSAVFYSAIYFLLQIVADISYSFIDPRIVLAQKNNVGLWRKIKSTIHRYYRVLLFDENNKIYNSSHNHSPHYKHKINLYLISKLTYRYNVFHTKIVACLWKNNNLTLQELSHQLGRDCTKYLQYLIDNQIISINNSKYYLHEQFLNHINPPKQLIYDGVKYDNDYNMWSRHIVDKVSDHLRYRYFVKYFIDNSIQETNTKISQELFDEQSINNINTNVSQLGNDEIKNPIIHIDSKMFEDVDIFSFSHEQVSGRPSTYLKDLMRRFFKSKTATIFTILLSFIILFSIITSLVNLNTLNNPISSNIPSSIIAYLPPRIPWLGISGVTNMIVDADTFNAINNLHIDGIYQRVEIIGTQYQLIDFNPYKIPGLENITTMLGTDGLGRDWWTLLWYSTLQSLILAIIVAVFSVLIGTIYGAIAGSKVGTMIDVIMMRIVEILSGVPKILWVLIFGLVLAGGDLSLPIIALTLICVSWMWPSIVARTFIIKYKDAEFVQAAKTLGASEMRILFSHLLPNIAGRLLVIMVNMIPTVIFFEASLVFLGIKPATDISLGSMIETARLNPYLNLILGPTIMIILITLSAQLISNNLNDSLDPKVSGD